MRKNLGHTLPSAIAMMLLFACVGAGSAWAQDSKPAPDVPAAKVPENVEKRLTSLEKHIAELEASSRALRKELERIESARDALKINAANLRAEISGAPAVKAGKENKSPVNPGEPLENSADDSQRVRLFPFIMRMFLIILILGCVGVIGRLFVTRWNEEETEPMVEKETDLGTVRHPSTMQTVPDKVAPADSSSAETSQSKPKDDDKDKSIEFKNPSEGGSGESATEKTPGKDYY